MLDLTERKRAEQTLRELETEFAHMNRVNTMGELAASLAHEILHPIATARNNARAGIRFLEMSPPNLDAVRKTLNYVVRDADRAKDIVDRMRDHVKKAPPRRESFDLNEAVNEVIVMVRNAIAKTRIAVSTRFIDGLVTVHGDRVQLQQVVMNLVLNAVEAMGSLEKGSRELSIRIEQGQADGRVLVEMRDTGPGIDPGNLDRVFEPFYTTKTSGIGMGLSICRSIIDGAWGPVVGERQRAPGRRISVHPASSARKLMIFHSDSTRMVRRLLDDAFANVSAWSQMAALTDRPAAALGSGASCVGR